MPQFALNVPAKRAAKAPHPFYSLDTFARGYVEAMFFTNGDTGDSRETLLNDWGVECLTVAAVETIRTDCARFLATVMPNGSTVRAWLDAVAEDDAEPQYGNGFNSDDRAGHLFWYARQGHGIAWADDYAPSDWRYKLADGLQDACRAFGECHVEAYRRKIHVR